MTTANLKENRQEEKQVRYNNIDIDGTNVFYREAGLKTKPTILLLHGFPTSSHMFRDLIPVLAEKYHVVAPDYPGFGYSDMPNSSEFKYTFDNYASLVEKLTEELELSTYALYVMDYGAPIGFRLATKNPEKITAIVVQNGNAYEEGIAEFWDPIKAYWETGAKQEREALRWLTTLKATNWQYNNGVSDTSLVSPDSWAHDQALLDRPGNAEIQLDLFYDYRTNIPHYPEWQEYFRSQKPATLVVWGENDAIFVGAGAKPYQLDNPEAEVHSFDTGHFALETNGAEIAELMIEFLDRKIQK